MLPIRLCTHPWEKGGVTKCPPPLERKYFSKKYVFFTVKVVFIIKIVKKVKQAIDFFTISYILYIEHSRKIVAKDKTVLHV